MKRIHLLAIMLCTALWGCEQSKKDTQDLGVFDTQGAGHLFVRIKAVGQTTDYSSQATVMLKGTSSNLVATLSDNIYATDIEDQKVWKFTGDPNQGTVDPTLTDVKNIISSAALGADSKGYLYYIKYGQGSGSEGDGKIDVYSLKADGSEIPKRIINNFDVNGQSSSDLSFVRLGVDKNDVAWIVAKSMSSNKLYLARFNCQGSSTDQVNPTTISTGVTTSDDDNGIFDNGDLCFDGKHIMYVLGNDNTSGTTKIYTMDPYNSNILSYKWTVKESDGTNFNGSVNGAAFSSTGSMFISSSSGLYFIDQFSTNFSGTGTVKSVKVKDFNGLSDLATSYWPGVTNLPLTFKSVTCTKQGNSVSTTFQVADVINVDTYYVEFSFDGKNFTQVSSTKASQVEPNRNYTLVVPIK